MDDRPPELPTYRCPPLREVVLSLQFEPIKELNPLLGLLWQCFREDLPFVENHNPLPQAFEIFDFPASEQKVVQFKELPYPSPRVWFLNVEKTELIQVQEDRFIHNWRKVTGEEPYPRFESIRQTFRDEVDTFVDFLSTEQIEAPEINQCEVTYLSRIETCEIWRRHGELDRVFRCWNRLPEGSWLQEPENVVLLSKWIIHDSQAAVGRLHMSVQPARKKEDSSPVLSLNLTARGRPLGEGIDGAFRFFDLGRLWIVKAFADLTTEAMQELWGKGQ